MSFENPTQLRLGMSGNLSGRRYRVVGRVMMGMEDAGETYYWNEFNIVDDEGEPATLVYEQTERGGEWRLFTWFEPEYPITAEDAATKCAGDPLNLDGTQVRVTLVDESRVYYIEGQAPEGVEVGDVARYFNAEAGNTMQVVSWTGDEVECYRGVDLPRGEVAAAFGLSAEPRQNFFSRQTSAFSSSGASDEGVKTGSGWVMKIVGALLGVAILFGGYSSCRSNRKAAAIVKKSAPASSLSVGDVGALDGKTFRIRGRVVVGMAEVGQLYDWHEYHLFADDSPGALLVHGFNPGANDWFLFRPIEPVLPLSPQQAAAVRAGETVNVDGIVAPVKQIFQATILQTEGERLTDLKNGDVLCGFTGQSGNTRLLVRWSNDGITFYQGKALGAKEVTAAFGSKPN